MNSNNSKDMTMDSDEERLQWVAADGKSGTTKQRACTDPTGSSLYHWDAAENQHVTTDDSRMMMVDRDDNMQLRGDEQDGQQRQDMDAVAVNNPSSSHGQAYDDDADSDDNFDFALNLGAGSNKASTNADKQHPKPGQYNLHKFVPEDSDKDGSDGDDEDDDDAASDATVNKRWSTSDAKPWSKSLPTLSSAGAAKKVPGNIQNLYDSDASDDDDEEAKVVIVTTNQKPPLSNQSKPPAPVRSAVPAKKPSDKSLDYSDNDFFETNSDDEDEPSSWTPTKNNKETSPAAAAPKTSSGTMEAKSCSSNNKDDYCCYGDDEDSN